MKYKVGDKIKIIKGTKGCLGAEGKIGIITNKPSTDGLIYYKDGFNIDCGDEHVWRIGFDSKCELLDELTAEEAIKIQAEMCSSISDCTNCPIHKEKGDYCCESFKAENPKKVVEIIKQWKKDHEKKEIETEIVDLIKVMKEVYDDETCIYAYEIDMNKEDVNEKMKELVKKYYEKHGDKIYAKYERICRVKS